MNPAVRALKDVAQDARALEAALRADFGGLSSKSRRAFIRLRGALDLLDSLPLETLLKASLDRESA